ncbi:MAG: carboxyl-terminal processing protease [bacterium]|jgi:carboxyl-terminal processing protease
MYKLITLILFSCLLFPTYVFSQTNHTYFQELEKLSKALQLVQKNYYQSIPNKQIIHSAIQGIFKNLDPHSQLLSKRQLQYLEQISLGKFIGIGIQAKLNQGKLIVTHVYEKSPAKKAGLKINFVIEEINNKSLKNLLNHQIQKMMLGKKGSFLVLKYYNPTEKKHHKISIQRTQFHASSIQVREKKEVLILKIFRFQKDTPQEIEKVLLQYQNQAVILDLRGNGGGLLLSAVEIVDFFLTQGLIVEAKNRDQKQTEHYQATSRQLYDKKVIILIDKRTASASEILAGALKDHKKGIIVGEKSFGKGTIQSIFHITEELGVKLTIAKYYTLSGKSFHKRGVMPDYAIKQSTVFRPYSKQDKVYQKALELLKNLR